MPISETFEFTPTDITLCRQIGRAWAARLAGAANAADRLTFVEPGTSSKGNIYAGSLPPRSMRHSPAVGIAPIAAPVSASDNGGGPLRTIAVEFTARAATLIRAMAILQAAKTWLLDHERTIVLPRTASTLYGQQVGNVIGMPPSLTGSDNGIGASEDLWATVHTAALTNLIPIATGDPNGAGTEEGEAEASMAIVFRVYPVRVRGAAEAFLALYDEEIIELGRGTIAVSATHLTITSNSPVGTTAISLAGKSIADVRTLIDAVAGWSTEDGDDTDNNGAATTLLAMAETDAFAAGGGPVGVGRTRTGDEIDGKLVAGGA
jgi:hypothetical protein